MQGREPGEDGSVHAYWAPGQQANPTSGKYSEQRFRFGVSQPGRACLLGVWPWGMDARPMIPESLAHLRESRGVELRRACLFVFPRWCVTVAKCHQIWTVSRQPDLLFVMTERRMQATAPKRRCAKTRHRD